MYFKFSVSCHLFPERYAASCLAIGGQNYPAGDEKNITFDNCFTCRSKSHHQARTQHDSCTESSLNY